MTLQQNQSNLSQPFLLTFAFFPLYAAKRIYLYVSRQTYRKSHSKQKIKKIDFSNGKEKYQECTRKTLSIGDIILINRDEVLQCDVLLLDCENDQCYSQTSFVDGVSNLSRKSPLNLTTVHKDSPLKGCMSEYRKLLTGEINYQIINESNFHNASFQGSVKLKKDPVAEEILPENILFRGSAIKFTDWAICLVLNLHQEKHQHNIKTTSKRFFFDKYLNYFNLFCLFLALMSLLFRIMRLTSKSALFDEIFEDKMFFLLFTNFILVIPTNMPMLLQLLSYYSKLRLEKKFKDALLMVEPDKFSYLSQISHILIDKNCLIDPNLSYVHSLFLSATHKMYYPPYFYNKKNKENNKLISELLPHREASLVITNKSKNEPAPQIILPFADDNSFTLTVSDERSISKAPNELKYKFYPEKRDFAHKKLIDLTENSEKPEGSIIDEKLDGSIIENFRKPSQDLKSPSNRNMLNSSGEAENYENLQEILKNNPSEKYEDFLKAILLCHEVRSKESCTKTENKIVNEFALPDSETILRFLQDVDYKFTKQCWVFNQKLRCYNVMIKNKKQQYYIIRSSIHFSNEGYYKFSILIKPSPMNKASDEINSIPSNEPPILLMRTNNPSLLDFHDIDDSEKEKLKNRIDFAKLAGFRIIIYSEKRNLSQEEINSYFSQENSDKIMSSHKESHHALEMKCKLLGFLTIKEKFQRESKVFLKDFLAIDEKIWVLSNDSEEKVLPLAYSSTLSLKENETLHLELSNEVNDCKEAWIKMRSALNKLKKMLLNESFGQSMNSNLQKTKTLMLQSFICRVPTGDHKAKFNVILNGKTLNTIVKDDDLLRHFVLITYFARVVIGFEVNSIGKEFLTRLIKEKFPQNPVVLAIGSGFHDLSMMKKSDVAVEMLNSESLQEKKSSEFLDCDISVCSFAVLKEIMRVNSLEFNEKIQNIIFFCYSSAFLYVVPLTLYTIFYGLIPEFIDPRYFVVRDVFIFNLLSFTYFIYAPNKEKIFQRHFIWTYKTGHDFLKNIFKRSFINIFIVSLMDSLFILVVSVYSETFFSHGNLSSSEEFNALIAIIVLLAPFAKLSKFYKFPALILFLKLIFAIFSFYIIFLIMSLNSSHEDLFKPSIIHSIMELFDHNPEVFLIMILVLSYFLLKSFAQFRFLLKGTSKNIYESIKKAYSEGTPIELIEKMDILKRNKANPMIFRTKNLAKAIRYIFKGKNFDLLVQDMLNPNEINVSEQGYSPMTLLFNDKDLEKLYNSGTKKQYVEKRRKILLFSCLQYFIITIILLALSEKYGDQNISAISYVLSVNTIFIFIYFTALKFEPVKFARKTFSYIFPLWSFVRLILILLFSGTQGLGSEIFVYLVFILIFFGSEYVISFKKYILICVLLYLFLVIKVSLSGELLMEKAGKYEGYSHFQKVSISLIMLFIFLHEILYKYMKELTYRKTFLNERSIKKENKKIGELLSILVPDFVKESLIRGEQTLSEDQGDVAILFCDICNFDLIIKHESCGVIKLLDNLYRIFDGFCLENNVQKIETVGKTYMACAGLKAVESTFQKPPKKNSTQRVINLALSMLSHCKRLTETHSIIVKIGIHFGPVIAGVIGYHKPQFSLIGDTVNTTSRVCSTGEENVITISNAAYSQIKNKYNNLEFKERKVVAKGKGEIITYQIIKKGNWKSEKNPSKTKDNKPAEKNIIMKNNEEFANIAQNIRNNIKQVTRIVNKGNQSERNGHIFKINSQNLLQNPSNKNFDHHNDAKLTRFTSAHNIKKLYFQNSDKLSLPNNNNTSENKSKSELASINEILCMNEKKSDLQEDGDKKSINSIFPKSLIPSYNAIYYLSNDPFKSLVLCNDQFPEEFDEKIEEYPGQFSQNIKKEETFCNQKELMSEEGFFDKLKVQEIKDQMLKFHWFWLSFTNETSNGLILEFLESIINEVYRLNSIEKIIFNIWFSFNSFSLIFASDFLMNFKTVLYIRIAMDILNWIIILRSKKQNMRKNIRLEKIVSFIFCFIMLNFFLTQYLITNYFGLENNLEMLFFFVVYINGQNISFGAAIIFFLYSSLFLLFYLIKMQDIRTLANIFLIIFCLSMIVYNFYVRFVNHLNNFNTIRLQNIKKDQQNDLIMNLLPSHILEKFLRNPNEKLNLTNVFEGVTILFADIAGFTKFSSSVSAFEVVSVLQDLFTEFDKLCIENSVYKLYTIGDCYVVLGLIDAEERNIEKEAYNVVQMGFQMIEKIEKVKKRVVFGDINMRIGIHTGKIIGGVIGTDIVRYDVYGKDVLIANKMESNGTEGKITISLKTKEVLEAAVPGYFIFEEYKDVHLPNFNETVKTFQIADYQKNH